MNDLTTTPQDFFPVEKVGLPIDPRLVGGQYVTSLDLKDANDKSLFIKAIQDEIPGSDDWVGKQLSLVGYVCSPAEKPDKETGELKQWVRTVLILADGVMFSNGSRGVWQSLGVFSQLQGPAPWDPPLNVRLRRRKLPVGHWHWLELILDGGPKAPSKAGKRD